MKKHAKDTAIHRTGPSAPLRWLLASGHMPGPAAHLRDGFRVLDYGCGHGADVRHLLLQGYDAVGFDPYHGIVYDFERKPQPLTPLRETYHAILCTYVLNVVLDEDERYRILTRIWERLVPGGVAFVTVRRDLDGDTDSQRLIRLDFPLIHDGTDFATYRVTAAD